MKSKRARDAVEAEDKHVDPVEVDAPSKKRKRTADEDSSDLKKSKKDKKEKKDKKDKKKHSKESRKERKDKRKDLQDLPEQDDDEVNEEEDSPMADAESKPAAPVAEADADTDKPSKKDKKKKDKKEKKEKKTKGETQDADAAPTEDADNDAVADAKNKKKKSKKQKKSSDENTTDAANADADADAADANSSSQKADRHIVFVGNLPFTATASTIEAHFASLSPSSVRCMSDPNDTKPCRGFAFVEFAKVWHMRTCLDKFHHSMFDDGVSPARRINVELTAGGGGKTKQRQDKIREKNIKLDENRTKRIEREKVAKEESKANNTQQHMEDAIHPSRRARVPGNY